MDLDFLYPDSEAISLNLSQLRNSSLNTSAGSGTAGSGSGGVSGTGGGNSSTPGHGSATVGGNTGSNIGNTSTRSIILNDLNRRSSDSIER